jgi:hypothetical protein
MGSSPIALTNKNKDLRQNSKNQQAGFCRGKQSLSTLHEMAQVTRPRDLMGRLRERASCRSLDRCGAILDRLQTVPRIDSVTLERRTFILNQSGALKSF